MKRQLWSLCRRGAPLHRLSESTCSSIRSHSVVEEDIRRWRTTKGTATKEMTGNERNRERNKAGFPVSIGMAIGYEEEEPCIFERSRTKIFGALKEIPIWLLRNLETIPSVSELLDSRPIKICAKVRRLCRRVTPSE